MTSKDIKHTKRAGAVPLPFVSSSKRSSLTRGMTLSLSIIIFFFLILDPKSTVMHASKAVNICLLSIFPSLFPFAVASELFISADGGRLVGKIFSAPMHLLFKLSGNCSGALFLGIACGSPVGAKAALSLYRRGDISRAELEKLICFCNIPSPAFIIGAVGASMFSSLRLGIILYIITIISAIITGITFSIPSVKPSAKDNRITALPQAHDQSGITIFTDAVASSFHAILNVCAFVIFFYCAVGAISSFIPRTLIPDDIRALLFGFFEISSGMHTASLLHSPDTAAIAAAAISGWSGLSVHFQIIALCRNTDISFSPYILSKLTQGFLNVILMVLCIHLKLIP